MAIEIFSVKEQCRLMDQWLEQRLKTLLPRLMKRASIDMWVVLSQEYNEDPVFCTLMPALQKTASRLSGLVFYMDSESELECLSLGRKNIQVERIYKGCWESDKETQWECLKRIVDKRKPNRIGINISKAFALSDGLSKTLFDELTEALRDEYSDRLVSAERLSVGWLETRSEEELDIYPSIYSIACEIINEAFSKAVIVPGTTTTQDVEWWICDRINSLGLEAWFAPTIDLQRRGTLEKRISNTVIMPGDLLHCDVGIKYMGLCTDTQRVAYVFKAEEKEAPKGILEAMSVCNSFQDIVLDCFKEGLTGNEVLAAALLKAQTQGIKSMLYTHPIGSYGHGAGPIIGLWDNQAYVPLKGDCPLCYDTCYALELNTSSSVLEWDNQDIVIFLEETVAFTHEGIRYLGGRQTEPIII